jgi:site-specific recombinase
VQGVSVFPTQGSEARLLADLEQMRTALAAERAARTRAEQTMTEQEDRFDRLQTERRNLVQLRDNFHELYREERDRREAAERFAEDCAIERDDLQAAVLRLHCEAQQLATALSRLEQQHPQSPPAVELQGSAAPSWTAPRVENR